LVQGPAESTPAGSLFWLLRFFACTIEKLAQVIRTNGVAPPIFSNPIKYLALTEGCFSSKITNLKLKTREVIVIIFQLVAAY
jgi:hypothetical protein